MTWPVRRERPPIPSTCTHLDVGAVEREIIRTSGNVSAAAKAMGVPSRDLRTMTRSVPALIDAALDTVEQRLDDAVETILDGLEDENIEVRLDAARVWLRYVARRGGEGFGEVPQRTAVGARHSAHGAPLTASTARLQRSASHTRLR